MFSNYYFNKITDVYDAMNVVGSDRLFKIKKKKTDIDSLPKEEVINCLCGSNQEDGLMIQVLFIYTFIFAINLIKSIVIILNTNSFSVTFAYAGSMVFVIKLNLKMKYQIIMFAQVV